MSEKESCPGNADQTEKELQPEAGKCRIMWDWSVGSWSCMLLCRFAAIPPPDPTFFPP